MSYQVGQIYVNNHPLVTTTVNVAGAAKAVIQDAKTGGVLIHRDNPTEAWQPVTEIDKPIGFADLKAHYGTWHDQEITHGHFRQTVDRPVDGIVQDDEVDSFAAKASGTFQDQVTEGYMTSQLQDASIQPADSPNLQMTFQVAAIKPLLPFGLQPIAHTSACI